MLDTNIHLDINVERQERKETEGDINKAFEDKIGKLRAEMQQEKRTREMGESNTIAT